MAARAKRTNSSWNIHSWLAVALRNGACDLAATDLTWSVNTFTRALFFFNGLVSGTRAHRTPLMKSRDEGPSGPRQFCPYTIVIKLDGVD